MLATDWCVQRGRTLDMTLREGVTFHDGTPFDAEAVKANIERAKTLEGRPSPPTWPVSASGGRRRPTTCG